MHCDACLSYQHIEDRVGRTRSSRPSWLYNVHETLFRIRIISLLCKKKKKTTLLVNIVSIILIERQYFEKEIISFFFFFKTVSYYVTPGSQTCYLAHAGVNLLILSAS